MSVQELNFYWAMYDKLMKVSKFEDNINVEIKFGIGGEIDFNLDHNQADLLRLYLTEHLSK